MNLIQLRQLVGEILSLEEADPVDWRLVERRIGELYERLAAQPDTVVPQIVDHYLADADIRERNVKYAQRQRDEVRHFVDTGEYLDSTPIPKSACLLTAALLLALVAWAVF